MKGVGSRDEHMKANRTRALSINQGSSRELLFLMTIYDVKCSSQILKTQVFHAICVQQSV